MNTIGSITLTGYRVWVWDSVSVRIKSVELAGHSGDYTQRTSVGPRTGIITGVNGPATLTATGSDADDALEALHEAEMLIDDIVFAGQPVSWADDAGRSGNELIVLSFQRMGAPKVGQCSDGYRASRRYQMRVKECTGVIE